MSNAKSPNLKAGLDAITKAMADHKTIVCESTLARSLGISKQAVNNWWRKARPSVPSTRVLDVEAALGIPRYVLRPDIYPHPSRDKRYIKQAAKKIGGGNHAG